MAHQRQVTILVIPQRMSALAVVLLGSVLRICTAEAAVTAMPTSSEPARIGHGRILRARLAKLSFSIFGPVSRSFAKD